MSSSPHEIDRPMLIELIGTPGAGKTTLAREIVSLLSERGFVAAMPTDAARRSAGRTRTGRAVSSLAPPVFRDRLLWLVFYALGTLSGLRFMREHHRLVQKVVGTQLRRPVPVATKRHILFWFFQLGGRRRLLSSAGRGGEVLVFDDGFLHRCVHLSASHLEEPLPSWVNDYVDLVPRPAAVVHVVARTETCERRVLKRGVWPHSRHLSRSELSTYLTNASKTAALAAERAGERGWSIGAIDNEERSVEDVRRDLEQILQPLFATRPTAATGSAT